MYDSGDLL